MNTCTKTTQQQRQQSSPQTLKFVPMLKYEKAVAAAEKSQENAGKALKVAKTYRKAYKTLRKQYDSTYVDVPDIELGPDLNVNIQGLLDEINNSHDEFLKSMLAAD